MTREEIIGHCNAYGYSDEEVGAYKDGYQQGRADALAGVFSKMEQPDRCVFNSKNNCCYPISSCWECPISELKEQTNE